MKYTVQKFIAAAVLLLSVSAVSAQSRNSTQPHTGNVTAMASSADAVFSVGQDSFIIRWSTDGEGERYQMSNLEIKDIAVHPDGNLLAIYETDGFSINRIRLFDWKAKTNKLTKRFPNPVTSLSFSDNGTYLMVGSNGVDGISFINTSTLKTVVKIREKPSMVTMAYTSATENSGVFYSQLGYLVYGNLKNQETKTELSVEANLDQPVLFNNNLMFAGFKDGYIWIYHAYSAKLLAKIRANKPQLVTLRSDTDLYYIEQEGKNYTLKMVDIEGVTVPSYSVIVRNFYTEERPSIVTATATRTHIYAGCDDGTIQTVSKDSDTVLTAATCISQNPYDKILDISENGNDFYILSEKSLIRTTFNGKENEPLMTNPGYTNILRIDEDTLLFWSRDQKKPVAQAKESEGWNLRTIYTPSLNLMNIHYENGAMVLVEGSSTVTLYSFETNTSKRLYTGTGVQDALLYDENTLYVAKSAASSPKSALIEVNVSTQETLALPVTAEVSFSLSSSTTGGTKSFYGISVFSTPAEKTEIFTYTPSTKKYSAIVTFPEEDTEAFVYYTNGRLYTNISQDKIRSITVSSRKQTAYNRYKALPEKLTVNDTHLLVLNKDGSLSWFSATSSTSYGTWYLTIEGEWVTFK